MGMAQPIGADPFGPRILDGKPRVPASFREVKAVAGGEARLESWDALAPIRGILIGLILGVVAWALIGVAIAALFGFGAN